MLKRLLGGPWRPLQCCEHMSIAPYLPIHRSLPFSLSAALVDCPEEWMSCLGSVLLRHLCYHDLSCRPVPLQQPHSSQQCLGELPKPLPRLAAPQETYKNHSHQHPLRITISNAWLHPTSPAAEHGHVKASACRYQERYSQKGPASNVHTSSSKQPHTTA